MKILASLLLLFLTSDLNTNVHVNRDISIPTEKTEWEILIDKVIQVESEGKFDAVGDGGKAVGILQIHPITVRDVNRIIGEDLYSYDDRLCPLKSIEMFEIYQAYYNPDKNLEKAAKLWNGGPHYYRYPKVERYWRKINNVKI